MNAISSQGMQIRRARQDDAAAIRELTRSAYAKWVPLIGREPTPMTADYDRAVREHMIDLLFVDAELTALMSPFMGGFIIMGILLPSWSRSPFVTTPRGAGQTPSH